MRSRRLTLGFAAVACAAAAASLWVGRTLGAASESRPDYVTGACGSEKHAAACSVALRYLAALDLDRGREACGLLAIDTLAAAGGIDGCTTMLAGARGIRIRYRLEEVTQTALGATIRFTTQGQSEAPVRQVMVVAPSGRIVAVLGAPR